MDPDRPAVCVDLDGVLNDFDGWKGAEFFHPPRAGAKEFLKALNERGFRVIVFTVRWAPHVESWLECHGLREYISEVTDKKPPAHVYIDDRAVCFEGDFARTLDLVTRFKAHWE
jgi:hypothetical protein